MQTVSEYMFVGYIWTKGLASEICFVVEIVVEWKK